MFLRYSLARFLRFWLLRQLYEGQAHIDQVVASLGGGSPAAGSRVGHHVRTSGTSGTRPATATS